MSKLYDGNSGLDQRSFIRNTEIAWKMLKRDASKHASGGVSQYEFLEETGLKVEGEARDVLDQYLDRWNWGQGRILVQNPNLEAAKEREEVRSQWRLYYHKHGVWARRISSTSSNAVAPSPPKVTEPPDIEEFLDELLVNFEAAASVNLQTLTYFRHVPGESLHMLATRFNRIARGIEYHRLMSSRSLAISLLHHLPPMIHDIVETEMNDQDKEREKHGLPLIEREELMNMARRAESTILKQEAEYRVAGEPLRPRKGAITQVHPNADHGFGANPSEIPYPCLYTARGKSA